MCPIAAIAPALTDLLGGQVQVLFGSAPRYGRVHQDRQVAALAVTSATRWEGLARCPGVSEFVPGLRGQLLVWPRAPRNTPAEIVDKLNKEINAASCRSEAKGTARRPRRHVACAARPPTSAS